MKVRFWGVRGSIPTPGPDTVRYGGNTPCVEVRLGGEIIILDAGTGLRKLGAHLEKEFGPHSPPLTLLITHTHWDHIQGLPFFQPAYRAGNHLRILGYEGATRRLREALSDQMQPAFFPVAFEELPACVSVEELEDTEFPIGSITVKSCFVSHPALCASYRLEGGGKSLVYMTDSEPRHDPGPGASTQGARPSVNFARHEAARLAAFLHRADVVIMDAQYDAEEYASRRGWGHACVDDAVELAVSAGAKRLFLFHHDPEHNDDTIARMAAHGQQLARSVNADLSVEAAREGLLVAL